MKILGIETSCDETAVAVVDGAKILASVVSSQDEIHAKYGGVVPELASRRHIETITPLLKEAISQSAVPLNRLDGIAVTRSPGLIGALLVGLSTAKAIAYALGLPLIGVNHLEGHLNAVYLSNSPPYPHIGLIVSGGHTSLYLVEGFGRYRLLGATRDDAAGEAFDKVARLLGLGYPGGPIIDAEAKKGDPDAVRFKTPRFTNLAEFDFSFSGIKTAVMLKFKELRSIGSVDQAAISNLIASFQKKVVDLLTKNLVKAAQRFDCKDIVVAGGVAANSSLRERLKQIEKDNDIKVYVPSKKLCTDNAAMIAYVGGKRLASGERSGLELNAVAVEEIGI